MEKGMLRAGYEKKKGFLMAPHPLTNSVVLEITEIVYCDTFGVEHVFQETFLAFKNTKRNIFRI